MRSLCLDRVPLVSDWIRSRIRTAKSNSDCGAHLQLHTLSASRSMLTTPQTGRDSEPHTHPSQPLLPIPPADTSRPPPTKSTHHQPSSTIDTLLANIHRPRPRIKHQRPDPRRPGRQPRLPQHQRHTTRVLHRLPPIPRRHPLRPNHPPPPPRRSQDRLHLQRKLCRPQRHQRRNGRRLPRRRPH